ncbi:MAG TPA: TrbI/VirB10 family protein [Candidatus Phascolarctobacterium stercoravium]|nr:TrbI/VirB10 family protein [Candidatus Phascolarctobacterium stercoravium]
MKDWLEKLKFILGIAKEEIDETEDNVFTEKSNIETPDEDAPEDEAKTLKGSLIKILAGGIIVVGVASVFSNFMTTPAEKKTEQADLSTINTRTNNPAAALPDSYAEIAKYEQQKKDLEKVPKKKSEQPKVDRENVAPVRYQQPVNVQRQYSGGRQNDSVAERAAKEAAAILASPILFDIGQQTANAAEQSAFGSSAPVFMQNNSRQTGYTLSAGTVIPATMLTGITSDSPGGDVVAQVRQDVYDSLTGKYLLIPQGTRLIGTSGTAGSRGNKRLGVIFKRLIFPNGTSVNLPDQQGIDGAGYPGLQDKYDDHSSTLYRSAFLAAIFAAAAQSATGDSNGYDNRSPGEEAVAGSVASILDTAQTIVERDANIAPTITISPGYQFSVFINQDFALGEYLYE